MVETNKTIWILTGSPVETDTLIIAKEIKSAYIIMMNSHPNR